MFLLFHSQHVSAQVGHQVIREEYTDDDGIRAKLQCYYKYENVLANLGRIRFDNLYSLDFKIKSRHNKF
jgi:hypothetical protein